MSGDFTLLNPFVSLIGTQWCQLVVLVRPAELVLELLGLLPSLSSGLFSTLLLNGFGIIFAGPGPHVLEVVVFRAWGCTAEWRDDGLFRGGSFRGGLAGEERSVQAIGELSVCCSTRRLAR